MKTTTSTDELHLQKVKTIELHLQKTERFINRSKILHKTNPNELPTFDSTVCQRSSKKKYCVQSFLYVGQHHNVFTSLEWLLNNYS